ncbi:hypothetical protein IV49_GL000180 [Kandleria vitulina DSM 20405]|uniref:Uncharacterized protein n=1 Tax=Kandleria vitulina DSM 20405 TaxID=1410657 RepID=A0A0R2HFV9_9FIRM|nr:hypothetical protein [Kandleria vitulina]KRN51560.1 hypothetical protein IV49_GL000180 [Kandleria vitulina DSM 20405]HAD22754.1 hypothetical protein [Kandleria vitulina]
MRKRFILYTVLMMFHVFVTIEGHTIDEAIVSCLYKGTELYWYIPDVLKYLLPYMLIMIFTILDIQTIHDNRLFIRMRMKNEISYRLYCIRRIMFLIISEVFIMMGLIIVIGMIKGMTFSLQSIPLATVNVICVELIFMMIYEIIRRFADGSFALCTNIMTMTLLCAWGFFLMYEKDYGLLSINPMSAHMVLRLSQKPFFNIHFTLFFILVLVFYLTLIGMPVGKDYD